MYRDTHLMRLLIAPRVVLALAACVGPREPEPAGDFRVAVVVDTTTDPESREQAEVLDGAEVAGDDAPRTAGLAEWFLRSMPVLY